mmetsp:Transcript_19219/g.52874  ORF Transcript_19219/g.52874 Transcript_19219/m.52874 type:complete len:212 (-) Transcript_19219:503-1138(-)
MDAKSQVERFLGGYSASAAESAVSYVLSEENTPQFKKARRRIAQKLLDKPICELVDVSDIEAVVVRDSIWSAVRQFKLPNEGELLDELYAEFGDEPMDILLPKDQPRGSTRPPKSAPLFERGRSILRDIIAGFLISDDWAGWIESRNGSPDEEQAAQLDGFEAPHAYSARDSAVAEERDAAGKVEAVADEIENASPSTGSSTNVATWDGWD